MLVPQRVVVVEFRVIAEGDVGFDALLVQLFQDVLAQVGGVRHHLINREPRLPGLLQQGKEGRDVGGLAQRCGGRGDDTGFDSDHDVRLHEWGATLPRRRSPFFVLPTTAPRGVESRAVGRERALDLPERLGGLSDERAEQVRGLGGVQKRGAGVVSVRLSEMYP